MKKLTILLTILLSTALCGFVFRPAPEENALPVRMTVSDGDGTEVSAEDEAAIREVFDFYLTLRAEALPLGEEIPEEAEAEFTVSFYEAADGEPFGVRASADGSLRFFGEEEQNAALAYYPAPYDEDAAAMRESVRLRLDAARSEPTIAAAEPAARETVPFVGEPVPMEEEPAAAQEASPELDADASDEPTPEPPADAAELLGSYDLALGGARIADYTVRTDPDTTPRWAEETDRVGAEAAAHYARGMDEYELRWQRWWTDGTRAESASAEEFENAREFYRTAANGFTEGLSVNGRDAFSFDFSGDVTVMWYDADLDLIFEITAFQGGVGGGEASLQTLLSLAERVSG